jgi:hypothetical protein
MTQQVYLAKKIKSIYDFNEFNLKPENLKELVNRVQILIDKRKYEQKYIDKFFEEIELGMVGNINRNPLSFLSLFYQYQEKNKKKLAI